MDNYSVRTFRSAIISYINQSQLPAEVKLLAVKDIASQLEAEANKAVAQEVSELERLKQAQEAVKEESEAREDGN